MFCTWQWNIGIKELNSVFNKFLNMRPSSTLRPNSAVKIQWLICTGMSEQNSEHPLTRMLQTLHLIVIQASERDVHPILISSLTSHVIVGEAKPELEVWVKKVEARVKRPLKWPVTRDCLWFVCWHVIQMRNFKIVWKIWLMKENCLLLSLFLGWEFYGFKG